MSQKIKTNKENKQTKMITLFKNFDINNLKFKPVRKTATESRIIDVDDEISIQTCWLKILYDVDYTICVDSGNLKDFLEKIDEKVIEESTNILGFSKQEIINMYKPLLKPSGNFNLSILTNTILFDSEKNYYDKSEIKSILKAGQYVRFIFSFKKIYFKNYEITFPLDLKQIELA